MSLQRQEQELGAHHVLLVPVLVWPVLVPVLVRAQEVVLLAAQRNWTITIVRNPERKAALRGIPVRPAGLEKRLQARDQDSPSDFGAT